VVHFLVVFLSFLCLSLADGKKELALNCTIQLTAALGFKIGVRNLLFF
jgi:hypothetical protein